MGQTKVQSTETAGYWVSPTLLSGWGPWDTGTIPTSSLSQWRSARYYVDAAGVVHLQGLVKNTSGANKTSTTGMDIFTLPAGLRPGHRLRFATTSQNTTAATNGMTDGINDCDIEVDGKVSIGQGGGAVPVNGWFSLNGISFIPEQ